MCLFIGSFLGGKSPSLVQGMGEEEEVVGGFGPDGSSSGFYGSSRSSPRSHNSQNFDPTNGERFSRKVFVGGLPPDIDEGEEDLKEKRLNIFGVQTFS